MCRIQWSRANRTCLSDRNDVITQRCVPSLPNRQQKNIRNEMRQATFIENLYKCLFVGDAVEIYEKDRLFVRRPPQHRHVMHTEHSFVSKSITCGHRLCLASASAAVAANEMRKSFFFRVINSGMRANRKRNERNWRKVKWFSSIISINDSLVPSP